jgi:hypothetical protein
MSAETAESKNFLETKSILVSAKLEMILIFLLYPESRSRPIMFLDVLSRQKGSIQIRRLPRGFENAGFRRSGDSRNPMFSEG